MGSREGPNHKLDEGRKTRQQKTRSSPNSKLLNAAWPKAPSVPTRRSQIKGIISIFNFGRPLSPLCPLPMSLPISYTIGGGRNEQGC